MLHRRALVAIAAGGLAAGTLDILYAVILTLSRDNSVVSLLQFIASGLVGNAAFEAGVVGAVLGLALHYSMAILIAAIFVAACQLKPANPLRDNPLLAGPLYGVAICFVMREIVVPMSNASIPAAGLRLSYQELAAMMFLVGLPIAIAAWKFDREPGAVTKSIW